MMFSHEMREWHSEGHPPDPDFHATAASCEVCDLVATLEEYRLTLCAYGANIDQTCDCKFAPSGIEMAALGHRRTSEMTGCAEIRRVQWLLRDGMK